MAQAREIKKRIRSVENTKKITRTMELVATSKLKRTQERLQAFRDYANELVGVMRDQAESLGGEVEDPLLDGRQVRRCVVVLVTSNRGLCGGFNSNLIRECRDHLQELDDKDVETELHCVGKKGAQYFRFQGREPARVITTVTDKPVVRDAEEIMDPLKERFLAGEIDAVHVVYSRFESAMTQRPGVSTVLPIGSEEIAGEVIGEDKSDKPVADFLYGADPVTILRTLLPLYLNITMLAPLIESAAGEMAARRVAMKSATDNAGEMITALTRVYNRVRQAQITQEIAEIVGGAAALD